MTRRESKVMRNFQFKIVTQLERGEFEAITLKNKLFVKWLVGYMAERCHPFQVVRLGPGVVRIIHGGRRCPHCAGKGFIANETAAKSPGGSATAARETECGGAAGRCPGGDESRACHARAA